MIDIGIFSMVNLGLSLALTLLLVPLFVTAYLGNYLR